MGGGSVTDDFHNNAQGNGPYTFIEYSTPKRYIAGAMLELSLKAGWSLELDGLFHPLGYTNAGREPNGTLNSVSPATVVTWEFPIMAKYRFHPGRFTPFLEGGAALRTTGNLNGANPTHTGFVAGAGVEVPFGRFHFFPEVRYTHWSADPLYAVRTDSNQVEVLAAFSTAPSSGGHFLGPRISFGVVAGATLTPDFPTSSASGIAITGNGSYPFTTTQTSGPRSFIVGPAASPWKPTPSIARNGRAARTRFPVTVRAIRMATMSPRGNFPCSANIRSATAASKRLSKPGLPFDWMAG